MNFFISLKDATKKIEHYCAYQERCHEEVITKLRSMKMDADEIDRIMAQLIQDNFLNEERFARSFARGKHRIKHWGTIRITNELKFRQINQRLIATALKEITPQEYAETLDLLAERTWQNISESNALKKRKKFCDSLLRKGFESNLVYQKAKELEALS
ncbi:regulatory protein RecX [Flavobacterium crassostreae]|uniref:Regulatory protein RecX n=1 Tax=Flavobacterium crassostreae TaxID=1763534 RepID=A0A1B9E076_9FLAO|nr:regulatory protein RecX [Flavobacterium crassostreae]OCB75352.1 recombinase RecX [Flavobacterium crassostreae]